MVGGSVGYYRLSTREVMREMSQMNRAKKWITIASVALGILVLSWFVLGNFGTGKYALYVVGFKALTVLYVGIYIDVLCLCALFMQVQKIQVWAAKRRVKHDTYNGDEVNRKTRAISIKSVMEKAWRRFLAFVGVIIFVFLGVAMPLFGVSLTKDTIYDIQHGPVIGVARAVSAEHHRAGRAGVTNDITYEGTFYRENQQGTSSVTDLERAKSPGLYRVKAQYDVSFGTYGLDDIAQPSQLYIVRVYPKTHALISVRSVK
ncbi:hypothetical protein ACFQY8_07120 [Alloscardovia venturai]|uniref:Uncharacterized protein n=1 Tax=Alloscardovia venturai TaxID=1769421 RepID=A0ABW2Y5H8_9BIFI